MGCCQDEDEVTFGEVVAVLVSLLVLGFWAWVALKLLKIL